MQTTLISHIYNEEYLLPFWLINHKDMFDNIIIIDYNCTDRSLEICKKICPNCKIIPSRNEYFDAQEVDKEVMDIERSIDGIKIVLNVTEFLICKNNIKDFFKENSTIPAAFEIKQGCPFSPEKYNFFPKNNRELFSKVFNKGVFISWIARSSRFIHNYPDGNYGTGRHFINYKGVERESNLLPPEKIQILYFGYYPLNKCMLERRIQIGKKLSKYDIDHRLGYHHLRSREEILDIIQRVLLHDACLLKDIPDLYNLLKNKLEQINSSKGNVLYNELIIDSDWGEDKVLIDEDINLLKNTEFEQDGYKVFNINTNPANFLFDNDLLRRFVTNEIRFITNKNIKLEDYHNLITDEEHTSIINRMPFNKNMYGDIGEFSENLEKYVSNILNEPVKIFNSDLWIRICRPNDVGTSHDFNPCHRDVYLNFYKNLLNIYLPICGSNELSSLKIVPSSHKLNENKIKVTKGGTYFKTINKKYSVNAIVASKENLNFIRPNPNPNQIMLFLPYLIHGCSENKNKNITRFSLEVRFVKDNEDSKEQVKEYAEFLKKRNWR